MTTTTAPHPAGPARVAELTAKVRADLADALAVAASFRDATIAVADGWKRSALTQGWPVATANALGRWTVGVCLDLAVEVVEAHA